MEPHFSYCMDAIKGTNRYYQALFLPAEVRKAAYAIFAFQAEIDRIVYLVSEPMPGEIRLQWWRDVLKGERVSEMQANPLSKALIEVIDTHQLPKDGFARFLDAKVFDLYNDPMPDTPTLEAYLGETESFILQMLCQISGVKADTAFANICGHGGVAIGVANLLQQLPFHLNKQQIYVPKNLLASCALDQAAWLSNSTDNHAMAYKGFVAFGAEHLAKAKVELKNINKAQHVCFLSLVHAEQSLKAADKKTTDLAEQIYISPLSRQWALFKASIFGI